MTTLLVLALSLPQLLLIVVGIGAAFTVLALVTRADGSARGAALAMYG